MVTNTEVDKVADMAAEKKRLGNMEMDRVANMVADKKMANMELDMAADMFKTKCIKPEIF